jgi:hypothetical protein
MENRMTPKSDGVALYVMSFFMSAVGFCRDFVAFRLVIERVVAVDHRLLSSSSSTESIPSKSFGE